MPIFEKLSKRGPKKSEEQIKQESEEFRKKYGDDRPAEKGIEEGELEDMVPYGSTISMMTPVGAGRKGARKLLKELAERPAPLFSDAVEAGRKPGAKSFSDWVKIEDKVEDVTEKASSSAKSAMKKTKPTDTLDYHMHEQTSVSKAKRTPTEQAHLDSLRKEYEEAYKTDMPRARAIEKEIKRFLEVKSK